VGAGILSSETTGEKQANRWRKGVSGNASVVNAAKSGDMRAAEILLRRVWQERKGRPVAFDFPAIETTADVTKALSAVVASIASGELTPEEATAVSSVIETKRKAIETQELEKRVVALERMAQESTKS
jgi:hypothetical protein